MTEVQWHGLVTFLVIIACQLTLIIVLLAGRT